MVKSQAVHFRYMFNFKGVNFLKEVQTKTKIMDIWDNQQQAQQQYQIFKATISRQQVTARIKGTIIILKKQFKIDDCATRG